LTGPAFSFDQGILQAVGAAALGVVNTSQWNKDLDNATNKASLKVFRMPMAAFRHFMPAKALIQLIW